jgi:hypothetical protein
MARNIEIKASIESVATLISRVAALATNGPTDLDQDDTFFRCENGRLKLRTFSAEQGELIFCRRPEHHLRIQSHVNAMRARMCAAGSTIDRGCTRYGTGYLKTVMRIIDPRGTFLKCALDIAQNVAILPGSDSFYMQHRAWCGGRARPESQNQI